MRRLPPPLVGLTPGDVAPSGRAPLLARVERAIEAGLRGVVLREPALGDGEVLELARRLRELLGPEGWLCVHDRVHLVTAARADAVQLGFRSLAPADARALLPKEVAVGFSAHTGDAPSLWAASDFLLLGPVFETPSKRGLKEPLGPTGFARECARLSRPVWALGGLDPERVSLLRGSGCAGIAVRGALLGAEDPRAATRAFLAALQT